MARESSPLCFRVSTEERRLVETVAAFLDQSVSEFARAALVEAASKVVEAEGADKIVRTIDERTESRKLSAATLRAVTVALDPRSR